jgi:CheY-like chemotaxis protein
MSCSPSATDVLLVDTNKQALADLQRSLSEAGYAVTTAGSFQEGKAFLAASQVPLLVTAVHLEAFNGLQLALQHQFSQPGAMRVVIDEVADPVTEAEVRELDAMYLVRSIAAAQLIVIAAAARRENSAPQRVDRRRSRRVGVGAGVAVALDGVPGRLVDICPGGFRVEMPNNPAVGSQVELESDAIPGRIRATLVWRRLDAAEVLQCGASIDGDDNQSPSVWQAFVEAFQPPISADRIGGASARGVPVE